MRRTHAHRSNIWRIRAREHRSVLLDAARLSDGRRFDCDLCVIGAGPAGIAIVDRLRDRGLSIILLESGGFEPELATQQLARGQNIGARYYDLDACRLRLFGGSTNNWGGWCLPLDAADFKQRDWLPASGWPIDEAQLEPYYPDAARLLELPDASFDLDAWADRLPVPFPLDNTDFQNVLLRYSPPTNFGEVYRARILNSPHVTTIVHANVTELRLDRDTSRIGELTFRSLTGRTCSVRPQAVVLAAGGIENARLLLASRADRPAGIGNEHDCVGRFFMEHLHVPAGHLVAAANAGREFYRQTTVGGATVRGLISTTATAQARYHLLGASLSVEAPSFSTRPPLLHWPPQLIFGPFATYRKLLKGPAKSLARFAKRSAEQVSTLPTRVRMSNQARTARRLAGLRAGAAHQLYSLYVRAEQAPDPRSRVQLSSARDALGSPQAQLDWRINPADISSIEGWLNALGRLVQQRGIGSLLLPTQGWQSAIVGGPHHLGTTRMSADPRSGVVDADCRVHSVANLYVAGCSVFATGGHANPTFSLVALALRLADTLGRRLQSPATTPTRTPRESSST